MTRELKNIEASIKRRLYNVAKKERLNFDFILLLFMQERLLYRLSISKYNRKFILKGGLLILSTTNFKTRPTRDIDFLAQNINNDIENVKKIFQEICKIEVRDGVVLDSESMTVKKIIETGNYEGIRIKFNSYLGNSRKLLQLDIGFGDVIVPNSIVLDYPVLLDFDVPKINVYSFESVIAEKFEAMLRISLTNSRMKDFYDIYLLSDIKSFSGKVLQKAILSTLQKRETPLEKKLVLFTEEFARDDGRIKMWNGYIKKIGKELIDFEIVMNRLRIFLLSIYEKILKKEEFSKKWDNNKGRWIGFVKG
jgi:predicted nucleotidyltransferase component of viral defense system